MKSNRKIFFTVVCLLGGLFSLSTYRSEASVTIKGKPLDEIDDIVSVATNGGKAEMKKYSLGILANETNDAGDIEKYLYVEQISGDSTASDTHRDYLQVGMPDVEASSGMHITASSLRNENGRAVLWAEYKADNTDKGVLTVWPYASFVKKDGEITGAKNIELTASHEIGTGITFDQDIDGGIFLPNDKNEYFAIAMLKNAKIADSGSPVCVANIFIVGMSLSDNDVKIFDTGLVIEKDIQQGYSPVSVAVGDFVGSGTTDQIAFTTASATGITMTVCQLKKDSDGKYSYEVLKEETPCTYTGRMKQGYIGSRSDYYPSAETVAGDFDGDGKTEIAVVFKDDVDEKDESTFGRINLTVYKWDNNSGSFTSDTENTYINYYKQGSWNSEYWVNFLGLKAVRCDFNGEGKDGIAVLLLGHYKAHVYSPPESYTPYEMRSEQICPYFMYWYCDQGAIHPHRSTLDSKNNQYFDGWGIDFGVLNDHGTPYECIFGDTTEDKEGTFYYNKYNPGGSSERVEGNPLHGGYPYVDRTFTLASGPFTGQLGTLKMIDDLAVSWAGKSDEDPRANAGHAYIFKVNHNPSSGKFIGVSRGKEVVTISNSKPGNKLAIIRADFFGEGVELEEPVHLKVESDRTYAAILQVTPYHVDYIPVPWGADKKPALTNFTYSTKLKTSYTHETTSTTSYDVQFDMKGSAETIEGAGISNVGLIKKVASFALDKAVAKGAGAVLDALVDKVDTTKYESNASSITKTLTNSVETVTSDIVLYYSTNVHVWRYPIKAPAPEWLFSNLIEGDDAGLSGDKFLTFSMADDPVFHTSAGVEDELYQPLHEEGNLFSYPTNLAMTPGYSNRQLELTGQNSITYSPGSYTQTVTITQEAASKTTETREVKYGTISNVIGIVKVMSGNATENSMSGERGNSSTFTKSYSTTDTLTASFPNPQGDYANVTFTTSLQAYADEAGILTLGFAVSNFGSTAPLWQKSIYNEKPDPSLYLPYRYYFEDNNVHARNDADIATKMRGVRFYVPEAYKYSGSMLYSGEKYRIEIPIYNASFVALDGPVEVALSFRDKGSSDKTLIATQSVTIGGWEAGTENNKAIVSFDWTVPQDIMGAKELVVEIDPDNKLDEVHEGWDPKVPGGNNFGYFPFSIVKPTSLPFSNSIHDIKLSSITINGMSMGDFIAYAGKQSKPFEAECVITNQGTSHLFTSLELNMHSTSNDKVESLTHIVGLVKSGENHTYKFLAVPEKWAKCDELEAIFHTDRGIVRITASKSGTDTPETDKGVSSTSGGGCEGFSVPLLGVMLSALIIRRKIR